MYKRALASLALGALLLAGRAAAWEIPLEVREHGGKAGFRYVSGGVPLLPGQAKETDQLRLARKAGPGRLVPVPAQFRVLARWWRADDSIRWVLVDFQTVMKAGEVQGFVLTDAKLAAPAPGDKLVIEETGDAITVTTGPARFAVGRKRFAFLESAFVDADGDGKFAPDENLLATTPECGTVLEDAFKVKYHSSQGTRSVEVVEKGPMRVRVRARGLHKAPGGEGYSKGLYSYDYFMDFYAGGTTVFVDLIIGNNFPKSPGTPCFEDASLILKLRGGIKDYSLAGESPHAGKLEGGQSVCLYQDSNGAKTWESCPGVARMTVRGWRALKTQCSSFRGYKVWRRAGGEEEEIAKGDHARGTVHAAGDRGGLVVHTLNFWQQFPKGVEVAADGTVRLALFPREYRVPHFLEDAGAKGHEVVLHFYSPKRAGVYPRAGGGRPDVPALAGCWDRRVYPRPAKLEHLAACGALADLGPFTVPVDGLTKKPNNRTEAYGSRMLGGDELYGNAYGWQVFGERWRSCGGHSKHGARQPMNQDNYLYRWYVTGVHDWLLNGDARSRQFRDVRCYRIEDVDPFGYKDWDEFRANNRSEDWTRRAQPKDAEVTKYQGGRYGRTVWWLPNPAHMTMDLIYDRYLLMGDQRSFENMYTIAAHGGYYAAYRKPVVHRATGWSWRACYRYWELTGDKNAEKLLKLSIKNFRGMVDKQVQFPWRKKDVELNWWFTNVFCNAAAMTAVHTRDPDALEICKRMAAAIAPLAGKYKKGYSHGYFSELYGALYHLTGEEKYKKLVAPEGSADGLKRVVGGMYSPACAHWLLFQPPKVMK